jgi:[ribosomal protein S18]-alanine N-acetyltransferase
MRIERFRWWHIAEVMPMEDDLFGAEKWSTAMFWNELAQHNFYVVATDPALAEAGRDVAATGPAEVVGYAGLAVTQDEAWVQNIAVKRTAQRRGIGRHLLEALLAEADRQEIKQTLLEVAVDNAPAQHLYATYDFEPVGIRRGYYQPSNTDALVMMRHA